MSDTKTRRGPVLIEADLPVAHTPQDAPPVPEEGGRAMQQVTALAARKSSWIMKLFWGGTSALLGMVVSVAVWDFVTGLLARNALLGQVALGLLTLVGGLLLLVILRELVAFARLSRVDALRVQVNEALSDGTRPRSQAVVGRLTSFYAGREELRWARQSLAEHSDGIFDGPDLIDLAERELMAPLDALAATQIQLAARNVAGATALIPIALADVAVALTANVRMVRQIAEIYGGRAGTLGSWRLLRAVATHLLATGAVAVGDDLIGSVAGGVALSKGSRRFGEGVINGALTARVGVAAMEVCRPMPFTALKRPSVTGILKRALVGLFK
ncbi:MAG: YcjF family protein [Alphaproteobacteria bacterium]